MSITDELREYAHDCCARIDDDIHAIADRIDAEHQKAMSRAGQLLADAEKDRDYNYANWQECKQKVLQGNITFDELNARIECLEDELSHYIELPKDADGETIYVGDMMETERFGVVEVEGFIHNAIAFNAYDPQPARICTVPANQCRHYHEPTVEDVLREFALRAAGKECMTIRRDVMAEFAAKLRLADDGEEQ